MNVFAEMAEVTTKCDERMDECEMSYEMAVLIVKCVYDSFEKQNQLLKCSQSEVKNVVYLNTNDVEVICCEVSEEANMMKNQNDLNEETAQTLPETCEDAFDSKSLC